MLECGLFSLDCVNDCDAWLSGLTASRAGIRGRAGNESATQGGLLV